MFDNGKVQTPDNLIGNVIRRLFSKASHTAIYIFGFVSAENRCGIVEIFSTLVAKYFDIRLVCKLDRVKFYHNIVESADVLVCGPLNEALGLHKLMVVEGSVFLVVFVLPGLVYEYIVAVFSIYYNVPKLLTYRIIFI